MEFKIGDLVTGMSETCYGITNSFSTCRIVEIDEYEIRVKVISTRQEIHKRDVGSEHWVEKDKMVLIESRKNNNHLE